MREYEVMLILPPDADDPAIDGVVERITGILAQGGGQVAQVDKWGRRRLAYEIARHTEGYYTVVRFSADPSAIRELDRMLTLADDVIRFKVVLRGKAA